MTGQVQTGEERLILLRQRELAYCFMPDSDCVSNNIENKGLIQFIPG